MAIGDAIAVVLGSAETDRQPASGVEEQITAIVKGGTTGAPAIYDGSNTAEIIVPGNQTNLDVVDAAQAGVASGNMALMITNSVYLRKTTASDTVYFAGVQTNV